MQFLRVQYEQVSLAKCFTFRGHHVMVSRWDPHLDPHSIIKALVQVGLQY
jgi:hypothetical protein